MEKDEEEEEKMAPLQVVIETLKGTLGVGFKLLRIETFKNNSGKNTERQIAASVSHTGFQGVLQIHFK